MSIRTQILAALRTDFNVTGMQKSWKSVMNLKEIPEGLLPSYYVGFGTAVNNETAEYTAIWEIPVLVVVYFKCSSDTTNQGLLETEAESLISLYENVTFANTILIDAVKDAVMVSVTPYVNTIIENRGFLFLEYKLTYIGN